jgi:hypothetical protein
MKVRRIQLGANMIVSRILQEATIVSILEKATMMVSRISLEATMMVSRILLEATKMVSTVSIKATVSLSSTPVGENGVAS